MVRRLSARPVTMRRTLVDAETATARKLTAPDFQLINPGGDQLSRDALSGDSALISRTYSGTMDRRC